MVRISGATTPQPRINLWCTWGRHLQTTLRYKKKEDYDLYFIFHSYMRVSHVSDKATEFFFLSLSLLTGWQVSICNCCKPFFSLPYNCQLLCFWRLALSIVVEVFPLPSFQIFLLQGCLQQTRYAQLYALSMSGVYFLKFLKLIFLISPLEKLQRSLFHLSILFLTFFSSALFQMHLRPFLHFFPRVHISDPQRTTLQIQLFISFLSFPN